MKLGCICPIMVVTLQYYAACVLSLLFIEIDTVEKQYQLYYVICALQKILLRVSCP